MKKSRYNCCACTSCSAISYTSGIKTKEINEIVEKTIIENGGYPSFKGLYGFPAAACISVILL